MSIKKNYTENFKRRNEYSYIQIRIIFVYSFMYKTVTKILFINSVLKDLSKSMLMRFDMIRNYQVI